MNYYRDTEKCALEYQQNIKKEKAWKDQAFSELIDFEKKLLYSLQISCFSKNKLISRAAETGLSLP